MFELVADAEKYPEFLPLCLALRIRRREDLGADVTRVIADMTVGYKAIRETFTSKVALDRPNLDIQVAYLDGPFSKLDNRWRFVDAPGGCDVHFSIDYEFRSRALGLVMGAMFDQAFRKFAEAFERRADLIYAAKAE